MPVKHTFEITLGIEMSPEACEVVGQEAHIMPNGKSFCPVHKGKASATVEDDVEEIVARNQAVRNACFFFKQNEPMYEDSYLVPLDVTPTRKTLVES